jgi:hypothetical protein
MDMDWMTWECKRVQKRAQASLRCCGDVIDSMLARRGAEKIREMMYKKEKMDA